MPACPPFFWVNKSQDSACLSNCRDEQLARQRIRSHAVKAGHKTSRIKRPVKITPRDLKGSRRNSFSKVLPGTKAEDENQLALQNEDWPHQPNQLDTPPQPHPPPKPRLPPTANYPITILPLITHTDPFSSYPIPLDPQTLTTLSYFTQTWTFSAFKLPGCIGYGQPPLPQHIITSLVRDCLQDETRSYCLLAASAARLQYLHPHLRTHHHRQRTHAYAAKGMHGLRTLMMRRNERGKGWNEEDVTAIIFLAAYEIFCEDERAAEKHLCAVRRLCRVEIKNAWIRRLRGNLEVLVVRSLGGE